MESIHTLQEFMLHTKNVIYPLIVITLVSMLGFWRFLNGRAEDHNEHSEHSEHSD